MATAATSEAPSALAAHAAAVERALRRELDRRRGRIPRPLWAAMRYSLLAPAKRVRPALVRIWCEACGGRAHDAMPAAVAIEVLHTYSLIHDDLPCMDDAQERRGRPACHRAFGEAQAVLAGDALLTMAFEILGAVPRPDRAAALVGVLAQAAGAEGMVGGQVLDLAAAARAAADVERVHRRKTAALFEAAARMGALCADAPRRMVEAAGRFGRSFGMAFQAADDLLDWRAGEADGVSYPARFGEQRALEAMRRHAAEARRWLPARAGPRRELDALIGYITARAEP